jgi:hypothetical protein
MSNNQLERLKQLRQYAQGLKENPDTHEEGVNILAYIILIEKDE